MERCPTQAVLPLVGLAADNVIRDRYRSDRVGLLRGRETHEHRDLQGVVGSPSDNWFSRATVSQGHCFSGALFFGGTVFRGKVARTSTPG
ncbi:MAG: hypothetical protein ACQESR_18220 [Planctomycetota bacterium]